MGENEKTENCSVSGGVHQYTQLIAYFSKLINHISIYRRYIELDVMMNDIKNFYNTSGKREKIKNH